MTAAVALAQGEYAECLDCNGAGEVGTGRREHHTGMWITVTCTTCRGDGTVEAEAVQHCISCTVAFWTGDGCEHQDVLCVDCKRGCQDCADQTRATGMEADRVFARLALIGRAR